MALLKVGQTKVGKYVQIPVIDLKSLGMNDTGKAYKDFFQGYLIPLAFVREDERTLVTHDGIDVAQSNHTIFKYSWSEPKTGGKSGELTWGNVMWSDSGIRIEDGDEYDDPGVALGLLLKQDVQKKAPGLHGAPEGKYTMFDSNYTSLRIPCLWRPELDEDENVATTSDKNGKVSLKAGELVWLELTPNQFDKLVDTMILYKKQYTTMLKKQNKKGDFDASVVENQLYIMQFTKDPKAQMADRNKFTAVGPFDELALLNSVLETSSKEYPKMVDSLVTRYKWYNPIVEEVLSGELDEAVGIAMVHAEIANRLLVGWGEIAEDSGMSTEEVNELFVSKISQYTVAQAVTNSSSAIISKQTVDLGGDDDEDGEQLPF